MTKEGETLATSAQNAADRLLELVNDEATPEVIRLALTATCQGLATKVAESLTQRPAGATRKLVSEAETFKHLARWIIVAEREGVRPLAGATLAFGKSNGR